MTTATAKKSAKAEESDPIIFPVEFGGVSFGDETARVGFRVLREKLDINTADDILCGHRIACRIIVQPVGDDQAQQYSVDGIKFEIEGSADVTQVSFTRKHIKAGLTFAIAELNRGELSEFAKRSGRLEIHAVGEIPAKTGRNKAGTPATDEVNWRDHKIDELTGVTDHDITTLKEHGIRTMGELEDARKKDGSFRGIKGIGEKADERILESVLAWLDVNREAMDADDGGPLDDEDDDDDEDDE